MIRVSIGIEDVDDLLWDLAQALEKSKKVAPVMKTPPLAAMDELEPSGHSLLSKAFGAPHQR